MICTDRNSLPASPIGVAKGYRQVWRSLLNLLVQSKRLDHSLVSLDGTVIPSHEFTEQTGYSGKHLAVGTKLSLPVDRAGTPLAVSVAPGNYHDGALGFMTVANIYKPPRILDGILPDAERMAEPTLRADKGYDSLRFRQLVHDRGYRPLVPTQRCIPAEQAVGQLYAKDACRAREEALRRRAHARLAQGIPLAPVGWTARTPRSTRSCT